MVVILTTTAMIQWLSLRTWGQNSPNAEQDIDHIPLVDYETSKANAGKGPDEQTRGRRQAVGQRYDKQLFVKRNANTGGRPVITLSSWSETLPALPVVLSDAVLLGEVTNAEAHLSNDFSGVYSEFTVRVEEVFKNNQTTAVVPGALITTERQGGRVKVRSGQVIRYGIAGQDMPRVGQRYLLFLKANEQQFTIVTGYQLASGSVVPLDGENAPGHRVMKWAGDSFRGTDANQFLDEVRKAIAQSSGTTMP